MATTIITKNGSGAPLAGDLTAGELAVDLTNKRLYSKDSGGTVIELGTNAGSSTFADLTVSGDLTVDTDTLYVDSTNNRVGIGTTTTSEALTVAGSGTSARISLTDTDSVRASMTGLLEFDGTDNRAGFIGYDAGDMSLYAAVGDIKLSTGGAARLTIDETTGNVGIGTTSPDNKFHVVSGSAGEVAQFTGAIEARGLSIRSETNTDASAHVVFNSQSGGSKGMFTFETDGSERMRIDSSGNVGIGTSSPDASSKLHINSGVGGVAECLRLQNNLATVGGRGSSVVFESSATDIAEIAALTEGASNSGFLRFKTTSGGTSSERMRIDSSGKVGIGGASNGGDLQIYNASGGSLWLTDTGSRTYGIQTSGTSLLFRDESAATTRMMLTSNGDFLVGKSTTDFATVGMVLYGPSAGGNGSRVNITNDDNKTLNLNRLSGHGILVEFYKDGSSVGSISTNANSLPSDRNFKKNIKDLQLGLSFISSLKPVTYNYKMDDESDPVMTGLIAQDVEETLEKFGVAPNSMTLLQHNPVDDEKESDYQMDYSKLIPVLTKAIQEQQAMIETLQAQVAELQGAN